MFEYSFQKEFLENSSARVLEISFLENSFSLFTFKCPSELGMLGWCDGAG